MKQPELVLTPTPRLARASARAYAERQLEQGIGGWLRPAIMAWPAWLKSLLDDGLLESGDERVPLSGAQARVLWSEVIADDIFLATGRVARQLQASWQRLHEWDLTPPAEWPAAWLNEDTRRFRRWATAWQARVDEQGWLDPIAWAAELPGRIAAGEITLPDTIELRGFELALDPLPARIVEALSTRGVDVRRVKTESAPAQPGLVRADDPAQELERAARWARARLDAGDRRIAVVVPELEGRVSEIERVLRQVLAPDAFRLAAQTASPWHISLGLPLADWPLVADALSVLNSLPGRLDLLEFGALLRSPFLSGWVAERDTRAGLDAKLRALPGDRVTLFRVRQMMGDRLPELAARLDAWQACHNDAPETVDPSSWARQFSDELDAIGFGRGRPPDSREYQVLDAWAQVLEQLAGLDRVCGRLKRAQALTHLAALTGRVFREQNPGAPVEVLGVFEALGGEFDAVRVLGLDDARWPPPARPDPLLPRGLQKDIPETTPAGRLEYAKQVLAGLARTAPVVIFSWPGTRDDEILQPSRLLPGPEVVEQDAPPLEPAAMEQVVEDARAPSHPGGPVRGGTRLLANQSVCPFKAFAEHRLDAGELDHPRAGLDARARGTLLHDALEHFWKQVRNSATLGALLAGEDGFAAGEEALAGKQRAFNTTIQASATDASDQRAFDTVVRESAEYALSRLLDHNRLALTPAARTLETRRLEQRLRDWLALEQQRPPFSVSRIEQWLKLEVGGLKLRGKLDRVDTLDDGTTVLIDYKSGKVDTRGWFPEPRMHDPQLPLYCLHTEPPPAAIVFACLRPDQLGWQGLADENVHMPGVRPLADTKGVFADLDDWQALLDDWRERIAVLAADFRAGNATVDPRAPGVCEYCHLGALCRIKERSGHHG